jgi:hypothetical protein
MQHLDRWKQQLRHVPEHVWELRELPDEIATLPRLDELDLRWTPSLVRLRWLADLEARGCLVYV